MMKLVVSKIDASLYIYNIFLCKKSIIVGDEKNEKTFQAHSVILRARSPYFKRALSNDWARKEDGSTVFTKPNVSPAVFEIILKYIYSGTIDLNNQDPFPKQGNIADAKLSRVSRPGYAIRVKDKSHGPCFGDKDLWMKQNFNAYDSCSSDKDDYQERVTTLSKFWVLEYEVFQVVKK
ncbi:unnamed protein product [Rhizophagus irregularis]|nr:unnamed protein product [Rhizophagus irregularis]